MSESALVAAQRILDRHSGTGVPTYKDAGVVVERLREAVHELREILLVPRPGRGSVPEWNDVAEEVSRHVEAALSALTGGDTP